jgi:hypothetical protein
MMTSEGKSGKDMETKRRIRGGRYGAGKKIEKNDREMRIQARVVRRRNRLGCNVVCLFEGATLGKVDTAQSSQSL